MRTRTLLLLALGCGLAILAAGAVQLWMISDPPAPTAALRVGQGGRAGDADVTVLAARRQGDVVLVEVRIGGVDDSTGLDGFRVIGGGVSAPVELADPGTTCSALTVAAVVCTLGFDLTGAGSGQLRLVFSRADEQLRWLIVDR
jgi:hypothetical protein